MSLQELSLCNIWAVDGTFDVVTKLYGQLMTIHGITNDGLVLPLVYAFLPDRKLSPRLRQTCRKSTRMGIKARHYAYGFWEKFVKAALQVFPNVILHGCHFHFVEALMRNVSSAIKSRLSLQNKLVWVKNYDQHL